MNPALQEVRKTFNLAVPIMIGLLGQQFLQWTDSLMIGRGLGVDPLAGASFGGQIVSIFLIVGYGLCAAVHVMVSQAYGARSLDETESTVRHGLVVSCGYSVVAGLLITVGIDGAYLLGQPPHLVEIAQPYIILLGWSILPTVIYQCFRNCAEAYENTWIPLWVLIASILLNVFLNWVFIFGNLGAPRMEVTGAGLATLLARTAAALIMAWMVIRDPRYRISRAVLALHRITASVANRVLAIGVPTAFQILFEIGTFTFAILFMGWLGAEEVAAHQIAINFVGLTFMVPLGMGFALTIRVGHAIGEGDRERARRIGFSGIAFAALFMSACAVVFFLFRETLPHLFLDPEDPATPAVALLAGQFLVLAALFQLFDGAQVTAICSLRGTGDVRVPTMLQFVAFWVISMPLAVILAFGPVNPLPGGWVLPLNADLGGVGVWIGLLIALALAATFLTLRFHRVTRPDA